MPYFDPKYLPEGYWPRGYWPGKPEEKVQVVPGGSAVGRRRPDESLDRRRREEDLALAILLAA